MAVLEAGDWKSLCPFSPHIQHLDLTIGSLSHPIGRDVFETLCSSCPSDTVIFTRLKSLKLPASALHPIFLPRSLLALHVVVDIAPSEGASVARMAESLEVVTIYSPLIETFIVETPHDDFLYEEQFSRTFLLSPRIQDITLPMTVWRNDTIYALSAASHLRTIHFCNPGKKFITFRNSIEANNIATRPALLPLAGFASLQEISLCSFTLRYILDIIGHPNFPASRIVSLRLSFIFGVGIPRIDLMRVNQTVHDRFLSLRCYYLGFIQMELDEEILEEPFLPRYQLIDFLPLSDMDFLRLVVQTPTAIDFSVHDIRSMLRWRFMESVVELILSPSPRRSGGVPMLPLEVLCDVASACPALEVLGLRVECIPPKGLSIYAARFRNIRELRVGQSLGYRGTDSASTSYQHEEYMDLVRFLAYILCPWTAVSHSEDGWFEVDSILVHSISPWIQNSALMGNDKWVVVDDMLTMLWTERDGQAERIAEAHRVIAFLENVLDIARIS